MDEKIMDCMKKEIDVVKDEATLFCDVQYQFYEKWREKQDYLN